MKFPWNEGEPTLSVINNYIRDFCNLLPWLLRQSIAWPHLQILLWWACYLEFYHPLTRSDSSRLHITRGNNRWGLKGISTVNSNHSCVFPRVLQTVSEIELPVTFDQNQKTLYLKVSNLISGNHLYSFKLHQSLNFCQNTFVLKNDIIFSYLEKAPVWPIKFFLSNNFQLIL